MAMMTPKERLVQVQEEAYASVLKVVLAQNSTNPDRILASLREALNVSSESHLSIFASCVDETQQAAAPAPSPPPPPPLPPANMVKPLPGPGARAPTITTSAARGAKRTVSQALSHDSQSTADAPTPVSGKEADMESRRSKKQKKMVQLSGPANPAVPLESLVGTKVSRYWPKHGGWFEAVITDYNAGTGKHCLTYDFGTSKEMFEWYDVQSASAEECKILNEKVSLTGMSAKSRAVQTSQFLKSTRGRGRGPKGGRGGSRMVHL